MRLRFPLLVSFLIPVLLSAASAESVDGIPSSATLSRGTGLDKLEVYHDDFPDHIDYYARCKKGEVYFHIFITSCTNCSDGLVQETVIIHAGTVISLGSIRQLDKNRPWNSSERHQFEDR